MQEELFLTDGQFRRLLNSTDRPEDYGPATCSLVGALHRAERRSGNKWRVWLTRQDIREALTIFEERVQQYGAPADRQSLRFFVNDCPTARRLYDERAAGLDVPRETSEGEQ